MVVGEGFPTATRTLMPVSEMPTAPGSSMQFNADADEPEWANDWSADEYVANGRGRENSVKHGEARA